MLVKYDLHCHTKYSDGHLTIREQIRSAEAVGLEYLAITDHYKEGMPLLNSSVFSQYLNDIEQERKFSSVHVLKGLEVTVVNNKGELSVTDEQILKLDIMLVELSSQTEGVFENPPASKQKLMDNIVRCMVNVCSNEYVDAFAHPFNVGKLAIPLKPLDFPEVHIREIAKVFYETKTAFNIISPMCLWFPYMHVLEIAREYTEIVRIFADEDVKFVMGSDDHWTGVGYLDWAKKILKDAKVPQSQYNDPGIYLKD